jgi:hypothetical protein
MASLRDWLILFLLKIVFAFYSPYDIFPPAMNLRCARLLYSKLRQRVCVPIAKSDTLSFEVNHDG